MKILYLTTMTCHHLYVLEQIQAAGHEVVMVTEEGINFGNRAVFRERWKKFWRRPGLGKFFREFPFVRVPLFDGWRNRAERKMLPVQRTHEAVLHLKTVNDLGVHDLVSQDWDMVFVFGTRKISPELIRGFAQRKIPMVNVHCAVLPYIRGLESDMWSLFRRKWHEIGVTLHFVEEGLDTGTVIAQSPTSLSGISFPWQVRAVSTKKVPGLLLGQLEKIRNHPKEHFQPNDWKEKGVYFSFPGVFVLIGAFFNFYIGKLKRV